MMRMVEKRRLAPTRPAVVATLSDDKPTAPANGASRGGTTVWVAAAAVVLGVLLSAAARSWIVEAVMTLCIAGGVLAAPLVSLVAWLGMVLPERSLLHQSAPVLFAASLLWLTLAIVGAHAHSSR